MSNQPHHRPDTAGDVPPELARAADTLNAWHATFQALRPGPVSFRVDVVDVVHNGTRESAVQLWVILPTGPTCVHVPPALADELAGMLTHKAREARTGLASSDGRLHTPNGATPHD